MQFQIVPIDDAWFEIINVFHLNFRKGAARQPEPDEKEAHGQLASTLQEKPKDAPVSAQVTGPFTLTDRGYKLEVREFFLRELEAAPERVQ